MKCKAAFASALLAICIIAVPTTAMGQSTTETEESLHATTSAGITVTGALLEGNPDLINPEENEENVVNDIFAERPVERFGVFSAFAFLVQEAARVGVPINTIVLILLLPILATMVAFTRVIVGLPSLELLVPIALAYTFIALGVSLGLIILGAVVGASFASRVLLRKVPIMHFPKRALSLLLLALFVFAALTAAVSLNLEGVRELSIFPVLILTLLGDAVVTAQLRGSLRDTLIMTSVTIGLGLFGFLFATVESLRNAIILYPELVLLAIPLNLLMGRYFGLRFSELFRFKES